MSYFPKMNFWGTNNRSLVLFVLFIFTWRYGFLHLFYSSNVIFISLILWQPSCFFLLFAYRDLYNTLLLYWHFNLRSNTKYYNLWIFCVIIKNLKKGNIAHLVGSNNARMLLLASWRCCYRFGASISWLIAVFFVFRSNHMFVSIFILIFGVYSITCSQLSGAAHIFWYQVCDI